MSDETYYSDYIEINELNMWCEGSSENKPIKNNIIQEVKQKGYEAYNVDIVYDNFQGFWRWDCDIRKGKKINKTVGG